ncbi:DUF1772 domain-containing protein [Nocardia harenae]|uniref:DUF1772 domain-containing protein n=1 Tax=Nocardia harenae TaxID=358707 RepID=UPI00082C9215|nr:DUF1772 domain-containing protein [Nocardia harenae]
MTRARAIALWLLVIFVGIQFGAGWYEKVIVVHLWEQVPPAETLAAMTDSGFERAGTAFWPFVSPMVALLALVNIGFAWRAPGPMRRWWLAAALLMTTYAVVSYGWFVPQMVLFQRDGADWSPDRIADFVELWTSANYARMALGGVGWLCALRALSLSGDRARPLAD